MHFTATAFPALVFLAIASPAAAADTTTTPATARRSTNGLFSDIHNILFRRRSKRSASSSYPSSSLGRRSAANAGKQCVLQAADNPLATGTDTNVGGAFHSGSATQTHSHLSTPHSSSSSSSYTSSFSPPLPTTVFTTTTTTITTALAGKGTTTTKTTGKGSATSTASGASATSSWSKQFDASGSNFFDQWTFWSAADPTNGNVQFTTSDQASSANLTSITSDGDAIMRVDTTPVVSGNRMSVRIQSNDDWNGGLFLMDAVHMPIGCVRLSARSLETDLASFQGPTNGEIDIIEGVNMNTYNQCSLHTADGCTITSDFGGTGDLVAETDCSADLTGNQGCGIRSPDPSSYGEGFNAVGGGVYAMLWDDNGINVWFFNRTAIPKDITSEAPQPTSWGLPTARWPAATCNPDTFVHNHNAIFDTTLCGDWAGGAWATAPNGGGQSCAASTGAATCAAWVAGNGASFADAYWQVKSVKVFQTS
ncbi:hypothetical protein FRB96_009035 [Tulasnella sp. 330]|nr:hypothetical protein FRB96_009035 [Tulasnella sp. 330]